jgi:hypothetical protein
VVLYHELGHAFDAVLLRPAHRRRFKRIVGIRTRGWFTSRPPASEWFADAYTFCAERRRVRRARPATPYGYRATPRRHARVCALIEQAAADAHRDRRKGRPPAPRPPADAPPVAEPREPPPPPAPGEEPPSEGDAPPAGPYQPPAAPPPSLLPDCGEVEALITGCEPG